MSAFKKILAHVDTETKRLDAWHRALRLAEASGGAITLIDVIEELPVFLRRSSHGGPSLLETLKKEKSAELSTLADEARDRDIDVRVEVVYGKPFIELTKVVLEDGYDVVLETIDSGVLNLHGGVALKLMRKCPCPVWAVRPDRGESVRRIVAAVDPMSEYDADNGLDRAILDTALEIAELENAEVHVVHAWGGRVVEQAVFGPFAPELGEYAKEQVAALLEPYADDIPAERVHVELGDADHVILEAAKSVDADLLVMGTIVRTGFQGVLMGNTAERVLSNVPCSVLALKPSGFESPVHVD